MAFAPWLFTRSANLSMPLEPHCIGTYSICDSTIYTAGLLAQSYCQVMTLFVWLALFRSPGVLPAAKVRPRLLLFLDGLVGELVLDVLVLDALVLGLPLSGPLVGESLLVLLGESSLDGWWCILVVLWAATERMAKVMKRMSVGWKNIMLGEAKFKPNDNCGPEEGYLNWAIETSGNADERQMTGCEADPGRTVFL